MPLMVALFMKFKSKAKFLPFLLGMLVYFTFSVVCVSVVNIIFLNEGRPTSGLINGNVVVYCLYFAVVTGLLEEFGILIAFKKILVSHDDRKTSVVYALGHAAFDAFLIVGPALFVYITCSTAINELGIEGFKTEWSDTSNIDLDEIVKTLTELGVADILMMAFERLLYFAMHIFLSIMIFYSVKREVKAYFWMAVAIRGLCTIPGSLSNFGTYGGETGLRIVLSLILTVIVAFAGYIAVKLYVDYNRGEVLMPSALFKKKNV